MSVAVDGRATRRGLRPPPPDAMSSTDRSMTSWTASTWRCPATRPAHGRDAEAARVDVSSSPSRTLAAHRTVTLELLGSPGATEHRASAKPLLWRRTPARRLWLPGRHEDADPSPHADVGTARGRRDRGRRRDRVLHPESHEARVGGPDPGRPSGH